MDMVGLGKTNKKENSNVPGSKVESRSKQVVKECRGPVDLNAEWESFEKLIGGSSPSDSAPPSSRPGVPSMSVPAPVPKPQAHSANSLNSIRSEAEDHRRRPSRRESSSDELKARKSGNESKEEEESSDSESESDSSSEEESSEEASDSEDEESEVKPKKSKKTEETSSSEEETDNSDSDEEEEEDDSDQDTSSDSSAEEDSDNNAKTCVKASSKPTSRDDKSQPDKSRSSASRKNSHSPPAVKSHSRRSRSRSRSHSRSKSSKSRHRRDSSPRREKRRRDSSRDHKRRRNSHRSRRSHSRDRKYRRRSRSRSRSHRRRDRSRDRRRRGRSRSRSRDRSHRSHRRDRRHRRSRSRSRSRDRSRDRRHHHRAPTFETKRPDKKPLTYKESLRQKLLEAQKQAAEGKLEVSSNYTKDLMTLNEKPSSLPLNTIHPLMSIDTGLADKVTPQQALIQTMAAMHQKAQQLTGVAVPKYYNPAAVNPLKFAEQVKKRKLLWSKKDDASTGSAGASASATLTGPGSSNAPVPGKAVEVPVMPAKSGKAPSASADLSKASASGNASAGLQGKNQWQGTAFIQDDDGKVAAKFRKLMGIKHGEGTSDSESAAVTQDPVAQEQIEKQQKLFHQLDREYEFARMTTHTHRGVGLGFGTQAYHEANK